MDSHPRAHFDALEAMYANGPINQFFRPLIHIEEGTAEIRMAVTPPMPHAAGAAHGAVYFKMLDDAAFFAVQSLVTEAFVLTASFQLYLLAPVSEGEMVATGRVVHRTKRQYLAESVVESAGQVVARGSGSFIRSAISLDERVGYRPRKS
jgi:uncharacterized protein (TIGR00369 family)